MHDDVLQRYVQLLQNYYALEWLKNQGISSMPSKYMNFNNKYIRNLRHFYTSIIQGARSKINLVILGKRLFEKLRLKARNHIWKKKYVDSQIPWILYHKMYLICKFYWKLLSMLPYRFHNILQKLIWSRL